MLSSVENKTIVLKNACLILLCHNCTLIPAITDYECKYCTTLLISFNFKEVNSLRKQK